MLTVDIGFMRSYDYLDCYCGGRLSDIIPAGEKYTNVQHVRHRHNTENIFYL